MTRKERLARLAGLAVSLLPLAPAQAVAIPPDTVTTVFVSDTLSGCCSVAGVVLHESWPPAVPWRKPAWSW